MPLPNTVIPFPESIETVALRVKRPQQALRLRGIGKLNFFEEVKNYFLLVP